MGSNASLFGAASRGDTAELRELLLKGGDVHCKDLMGWTMLHWAARDGNLKMIKFLKSMRASAEERGELKHDGSLPLHLAAGEDRVEAIILLLEMREDTINRGDWEGRTPLHYASSKCKSKAVLCLISKGANVHAKDHEGKTAMHVAIDKGHMEIVQLFLSKGLTSVHDVDSKFGTLLHYSVRVDKEEMSEELIRRGSNINAQNRLGWTPLHFASENGSLKMTKFLIEKGADPTISQTYRKTAFDMAYKSSYLEVAAYLAQRMAEVLQRKAKYNDILKIHEKLLEMQKDDHEGLLKTQTLISMTQHKLELQKRVSETSKDNLNERMNALREFDNLCTKYETGNAYVVQSKYKDAKEVFKEVHGCWRDSLGDRHPLTLDVLRELANAHFQRCEYKEASEIYDDLFKKRKSISQANSPEILQAMKDLAVALANKGENKRALTLFKELLPNTESCLGEDHPDTQIIKYHIEIVKKKIENNPENGTCRLQ